LGRLVRGIPPFVPSQNRTTGGTLKKLLAALTAMTVLFVGCSGNDTNQDASEGVRIVSISPSATETLFAIGAGSLVVAVDEFSYFPAEAPVTDLSGWEPNVEAILGYEPDLVVMGSNGDLQANLEAAGVEVALTDAPDTLDGVYEQILQLGSVTGRSDAAAELVESMRQRIEAAVSSVSGSEGLSYFHELDDSLYTVTSSTFIGQLYGLFGMVNVADPADRDGAAFGYPQLSDEYLLDANPDVIVLADTVCCGQTAVLVGERPGWSELSAVQSNQVAEVNDDIASRWGPRVADFVEVIAASIAGS
jgi:iron complex transport system substrate-binding protein